MGYNYFRDSRQFFVQVHWKIV